MSENNELFEFVDAAGKGAKITLFFGSLETNPALAPLIPGLFYSALDSQRISSGTFG